MKSYKISVQDYESLVKYNRTQVSANKISECQVNTVIEVMCQIREGTSYKLVAKNVVIIEVNIVAGYGVDNDVIGHVTICTCDYYSATFIRESRERGRLGLS